MHSGWLRHDAWRKVGRCAMAPTVAYCDQPGATRGAAAQSLEAESALVEDRGDGDTTDKEEPDLSDDLVWLDAARGDGAVGLVDGVDFLVIPVVDSLCVACEEGPRHDHAEQQLRDLLGVVPLVVP